MMELAPGQTVYVVRARRHPDCTFIERTIQKIGRKWVELSDGKRFDKETMLLDGGAYSSPGKVYLAQQDFHDEQAFNSTFEAFRRAVQHQLAPSGLTLAKVRQAAEILGYKLDL
jgi:hypothetical protein